MVVKWQFHDPSMSETYVFEINPNDDGLPEYKKNFQVMSTSAPDGNVVVFEGRDEVRRGSFSGVTLSEEQHLKFIEWFEKRNQITVTDDLYRTFSIIIESYAPKRRFTRTRPWKHDYTMGYIIVDWQA